MATAGSGDVLTGIVASLLAQGYELPDAAVMATYLHGTAGDMAAARISSAGLIASDIAEEIGKWGQWIEKWKS
jgi:NAD(P)H-hydrate epimerase